MLACSCLQQKVIGEQVARGRLAGLIFACLRLQGPQLLIQQELQVCPMLEQKRVWRPRVGRSLQLLMKLVACPYLVFWKRERVHAGAGAGAGSQAAQLGIADGDTKG